MNNCPAGRNITSQEEQNEVETNTEIFGLIKMNPVIIEGTFGTCDIVKIELCQEPNNLNIFVNGIKQTRITEFKIIYKANEPHPLIEITASEKI